MTSPLRKMIENYADMVAHNFKSLHAIAPEIEQAAEKIWDAVSTDRTVFFCGNGGSAADSQHLAADILGRYRSPRKAMPAIALTVDTSALTALANDYGYDMVFAHQLDGLGKEGDILVAISTSGNSESILRAVQCARAKNIFTIGMTGQGGGKLKDITDLCLCAPSDKTNHIQEMHIALGHMICEYVENCAQSLEDYKSPSDYVLKKTG